MARSEARLQRTVDELIAALAERDPGLADVAFDVAAAGVAEVLAMIKSAPHVEDVDVLGMRYLPGHLEDPHRPGWLLPDELRLRRRSWMKCKLRDQVYEEARAHGTPCAMCSCTFTRDGRPPYVAIDHIVPLARGGTNTRANLQVLCEPCNTSKGARF